MPVLFEADSKNESSLTSIKPSETEEAPQSIPASENIPPQSLATHPSSKPVVNPQLETAPKNSKAMPSDVQAAVNIVRQFNLPLPEKSSRKMLGAFMSAPSHVHFATQGTGEIVLLFLRQHPITQLSWILGAVILIILPPFLFPLLGIFFPFPVPATYQLIFSIFYYLAVFAFIYVRFILWYYNVNIVTNVRLVDIDFIHLLIQEVSATRITQIEDVTYRRFGLWSTVFNYGNVLIQTAGAEANIEFLRVPDPKRITQIIIRLMGQTDPK